MKHRLSPFKHAKASLWLGGLLFFVQGFSTLAQVPSNFQGLTGSFRVVYGYWPFLSMGRFTADFGSNQAVLIHIGDLYEGHGWGCGPSIGNLASFDFVLTNEFDDVLGIMYLAFSDYKSGTFYASGHEWGHAWASHGEMYGTFTMTGSAVAAYEQYQNYASQALNSYNQTAATDVYLATAYFCRNYAYAAFYYALWDKGDYSLAANVYNYYNNLATTWMNKYNYNQSYTYYVALASTYYTNLLPSNPRQANYYKYIFLAYGSYSYWLREGDAVKAAAADNYYAGLAARYAP